MQYTNHKAKTQTEKGKKIKEHKIRVFVPGIVKNKNANEDVQEMEAERWRETERESTKLKNHTTFTTLKRRHRRL